MPSIGLPSIIELMPSIACDGVEAVAASAAANVSARRVTELESSTVGGSRRMFADDVDGRLNRSPTALADHALTRRRSRCASRQASWRHRAEWQLFYRQRRSQTTSGDPPTGPSRPRAPLCSALRGRHRHSITLCESPDLLSPPHVPPTHAKKRGRGVTTLLCSLEQAQRFINQTHSNTKSSAKTYRGKRRHYNLSLRLRLRLRLRRLHLRQLVQREVVRRNA